LGGDYTRFTFTPRKNYATVWKQQGRVRVDADEIELSDILDRRWRAETQDIIGRCAVPATTPDGFKIVPTGAGTFDILVGRLYADGLLAENHGREPLQYDRSLGEMRGTLPVPYSDQPYFPAPLPPPLPGTAGTTDLVFVDVWHREVTAVEDPSLLDVALGGVDTATRVQTIWQVRALQNVGPHDCADAIQAWTDEIAPSPSRLTTAARPTVDPGDVCDVPAAGGFRGRENRLYRVEVHAAGTVGGVGAAKFKWSRDNASLTTAVDAIAGGTDLTLRRLGRDEVFRFQVDDWMEVLDDRVEFRRQAGHMARITHIDAAARTITVSPAIPGSFAFNAGDPARHTRVRRWDQREGADPASGLLTVEAGTLPLEDGVEVTFTTDPGGGTLRVGDYWVFAARTADGSVESLQAAPPRGPIHHFCRLALVTWGATAAATTVQDCRVIWPPRLESCCTKVVKPGEDIQAAIDALPEAGGCICLKVGLHRIDKPIAIVRSNVTLHGETRGAVVERRDGGEVLRIGRALPDKTITSVSIESLTCRATGRAMVMIDVENVRGLEIASCDLAGLPARALVAAGIQLLWSSDVAVRGNRIANFVVGVQADLGGHVEISGNEFAGLVLGELGGGAMAGDAAVILGRNVNAPCLVERNVMRDFERGVFAPVAEPCVIAKNEIRRRARAARDPNRVVWGIEVTGAHSLVSDNLIESSAEHHGGVRVAGRHLRVEGNEVTRPPAREGQPQPPATGILVDQPGPDARSEACVIRGNHVVGARHGIVASGDAAIHARGIQIRDNVVAPFQFVREFTVNNAIWLRNASESEVSGNTVREYRAGLVLLSGYGNRAVGNTIVRTLGGVFLENQTGVEVSTNRIEDSELVGLMGRHVRDGLVNGNRIVPRFSRGIGILLVPEEGAGMNTVVVRDNHVLGGDMGIVTGRQAVAEIVGNRVEAAARIGISDSESVAVTIARNHVESCGFGGADGQAVTFGVLAVATRDRLTVDQCQIVRTGQSPDGKVTPGNTLAISASSTRHAHVTRNIVDGIVEANPDRTHGAIQILGATISTASDISVVGNILSGRARRLVDVPPVVIPILHISLVLARFGSGLCSGNECRHTIAGSASNLLDATVVMHARRLSVVNNVLFARDTRSFNFAGSAFITATSNITSGSWSNNLIGTWTNVANQLKPAPADNFNHIGVI
jgi:parallel beta-helix repeat protein